MNDVNVSLASQCMTFCQALANNSKAFTFSLTTGSGFNFTLDTKENLPSVAVRKKSPSARRRNARRKADFLKKKSEATASSTANQAENFVDVTLAARDGYQAGAHKVLISCSDPVEEEEDEIFEDAPTTLPCTSFLSRTTTSRPTYSHVAASSLPLIPSTFHVSAPPQPKFTPATPTAKPSRLVCTHCGLPKNNHPGPSGDGCMLDTNGSQLL